MDGKRSESELRSGFAGNHAVCMDAHTVTTYFAFCPSARTIRVHFVYILYISSGDSDSDPVPLRDCDVAGVDGVDTEYLFAGSQNDDDANQG